MAPRINGVWLHVTFLVYKELETFRFYDEYVNEYEIFSIPSSTRVNQRHFGGKMW